MRFCCRRISRTVTSRLTEMNHGGIAWRTHTCTWSFRMVGIKGYGLPSAAKRLPQALAPVVSCLSMFLSSGHLGVGGVKFSGLFVQACEPPDPPTIGPSDPRMSSRRSVQACRSPGARASTRPRVPGVPASKPKDADVEASHLIERSTERDRAIAACQLLRAQLALTVSDHANPVLCKSQCMRCDIRRS